MDLDRKAGKLLPLCLQLLSLWSEARFGSYFRTEKEVYHLADKNYQKLVKHKSKNSLVNYFSKEPASVWKLMVWHLENGKKRNAKLRTPTALARGALIQLALDVGRKILEVFDARPMAPPTPTQDYFEAYEEKFNEFNQESFAFRTKARNFTDLIEPTRERLNSVHIQRVYPESRKLSESLFEWFVQLCGGIMLGEGATSAPISEHEVNLLTSSDRIEILEELRDFARRIDLKTPEGTSNLQSAVASLQIAESNLRQLHAEAVEALPQWF